MSAIDKLIEIAQQGTAFTAADGQPFVRLALPFGGFSSLPIRDSSYRDWFFSRCYAEYGAIPSAHAFHAVLSHLEAQANYRGDNQRLAVFRRVGANEPGIHPPQILLDLADPDRHVVQISPGGWCIAHGEGTLLQTSRCTAPLP